MKTHKDVTMQDIAKALNISTSTVSRGLKDSYEISENTRSQIIATANALGYRTNIFASNLRSKKTNLIGVIVPRLNEKTTYEVLSELERALAKRGYNLLLTQTFDDEKKEIENADHLYWKGVDGLIISRTVKSRCISHFDQFFRKGLPVVSFDQDLIHPADTRTEIDYHAAAYQASQHLIAQGCKGIKHIKFQQHLVPVSSK